LLLLLLIVQQLTILFLNEQKRTIKIKSFRIFFVFFLIIFVRNLLFFFSDRFINTILRMDVHELIPIEHLDIQMDLSSRKKKKKCHGNRKLHHFKSRWPACVLDETKITQLNDRRNNNYQLNFTLLVSFFTTSKIQKLTQSSLSKMRQMLKRRNFMVRFYRSTNAKRLARHKQQRQQQQRNTHGNYEHQLNRFHKRIITIDDDDYLNHKLSLLHISK
jgi:hypothetical protein